jgi:hypothetical protein
MNEVMHFLQTTFGSLVFIFIVSNLAAIGAKIFAKLAGKAVAGGAS